MTRTLSENENMLAIEIADDWVKDVKSQATHPSTSLNIETKAKAFDQAYKAIVKTLSE